MSTCRSTILSRYESTIAAINISINETQLRL